MSIYDLGSEDPDIYIDGVSISSFKCLLNLLTGQDNRLSLEFISVYLYPGAIPLPAPPRHNLPRFVYTQEVEAELQSWRNLSDQSILENFRQLRARSAKVVAQDGRMDVSHNTERLF